MDKRLLFRFRLIGILFFSGIDRFLYLHLSIYKYTSCCSWSKTTSFYDRILAEYSWILWYILLLSSKEQAI